MSSRNETLIKAVLDETNMENYTPLSRNEQFLKDIITKKDQCTLKPISRIEEMYFNLHQKIKENSGGGGSLKTLLDATQSTSNLFYNYKGTSVDGLISYSDTENVIKMNNTFYYCSNLTTIPLINTSSATNMHEMFYSCSNLTTIPLIDTSKCTNMKGIFRECIALTTLPQLDTSSATDMSSMFENCYKLTTIDITHMKITSSYNSNSFAYACRSLTKLIIRNMDTIPNLDATAFGGCYHFKGTTDPTYNPQGLKDGRIYVPDNKVEELKTATNWSVYADIIVPLSTLVE